MSGLNIIGVGTKRTDGMTPGIYMIVNDDTGKLYVGSALKVRHRVMAHIRMLRSNSHDNIHLQRAWNVSGPGAFSYWRVEECAPESLVSKEQEYLDKYRDTHGRQKLYNIDTRAYSKLGFRHSPETRRRMSEIKLSMSPDEKARLGAAVRAANLARGAIQKMLAARKPAIKAPKPPRGPRKPPVSEETRRLISLAQIGRKQSEETCRKKSESHKRAWANGAWANRKTRLTPPPPWSDETRKKIVSALTGRKHNPETCRKRAASIKAWWARRKAAGL